MRMSVKTKLDLGPLKNYPKAAQGPMKELVVRTTIKIKNEIRDTAPVDRGALAAGYYVAAKSGHGGNKALSRALALRPEAEDYMKIAPLLPTPRSDWMAMIGSVMDYWDLVEYGRDGQMAQPHIEPAIRRNEPYFMLELQKILNDVAQSTGWKRSPETK